jgi:tetratricopeptide (TPR) repeat protein
MTCSKPVFRGRPPAILGLIVGVSALALSAAPAHAAKCSFGTEEHLRFIQDLSIKGPWGEDLYLGHKFSFQDVCFPYSLTDDGYIIGIKGQKKYYKLTAAQIADYQKDGVLPTPLPAYQFSIADYVIGNLLWICIACFVMLGLFGRWRQKQQSRALPIYSAGVELLNRGQFAAALDEFTKAAKLAPKLPGILVNRGHAYAGLEMVDLALKDYTTAVRMNPNDVSALMSRATMSLMRGNHDGAIIDLSKVIQLTEAELAYASRGDVYAKMGDFEAALKDFGKAIEVNPASAGAHRMRAKLHRAMNREDLAQADEARANEVIAAPAAMS